MTHENKNNQKSSNNRFTGFEVAYLASGKENFTDSEGYRKILERVYEMQRNGTEREDKCLKTNIQLNI